MVWAWTQISPTSVGAIWLETDEDTWLYAMMLLPGSDDIADLFSRAPLLADVSIIVDSPPVFSQLTAAVDRAFGKFRKDSATCDVTAEVSDPVLSGLMELSSFLSDGYRRSLPHIDPKDQSSEMISQKLDDVLPRLGSGLIDICDCYRNTDAPSFILKLFGKV